MEPMTLTGLLVALFLLMLRSAVRLETKGRGVLARGGIAVVRVAFLLLAVLASVGFAAACADAWRHRYQEPPVAFSGDSEGLKRSVVVPTLDTPIPEGKNAVWCASFAAAWDALVRDVLGDPVEIAEAGEFCARMNAASPPAGSLPVRSVALAGLVEDGIVERVRVEVRRVLGRSAEIPADLPAVGILAYSEMEASLPFPIPYAERDSGMRFIDSAGGETTVGAFGAWGHDDGRRARSQARILWESPVEEGDRDGPGEPGEFVVDPCADSAPDQILLARIPRGPTLADTLAALDERLRGAGEPRPMPRGTFLVPNISWEIAHRFREIEGRARTLRNPGFERTFVQTALQKTRFRLDRSGAEMRSVSMMSMMMSAAGRSRFLFDRPFLLVMKRRDAAQPYFAMWVDNAELLCRPRGEGGS